MHLDRARTLMVLVLMLSLCAQSGSAARLDGDTNIASVQLLISTEERF